MSSRPLRIPFVAEVRDAVRAIRGLDGEIDRVRRSAEEANDEINGGDGEGLEERRRQIREVEAAFRQLGLRSSRTAEQQRRAAVAAYDAIRNSGVASAEDIERAQEQLRRRLDAIDRSVGRNRRSFQDLARGVVSAARRMNAALRSASAASAAFSRTVASAGVRLGRAGFNIARNTALIGSAVGGAFFTSVVKTGAEIENYTATLTSLEGSSRGAQRALDFVTRFATDTPLALNEVIQAYVKLKAFGIDPTNGSLQALTDQNAKLGGDFQNLEGLILAVGQAYAKQKLQGEEILQLVERGVPVWDLLQKATGKNVTELQELSSKGQLGRKVIKQLLDEIARSSKGAASEQMTTFSGLLSRLNNEFFLFQKRVADAGFFETIKTQFRDILSAIEAGVKSGAVGKFAKDLSDLGVAAVLFARSIVTDLVAILNGRDTKVQNKFLLDVRDAVVALVEYVKANREQIGQAFSGLVSAFSGLVPVIVDFGNFLRNADQFLKSMGVSASKVALVLGGLFVGLPILTGALSLLAAIFSPAGAVVAGVSGLVYLIYLLIAGSEEAKDKFAELFGNTFGRLGKFIILGVAAALEFAAESVAKVAGDILKLGASIIQFFGEAVANVFIDAVKLLASLIENVGDLIANVILAPFRAAKGLIDRVTGGTDNTPAFASGGHIRGPGTGTSDSILARLSNGEYVIKAAAVRRFGVGFFDALNGLRMPLAPQVGFGGIPAFADGGLVSSGGRPITLNLNGESFSMNAPEDVARRLEKHQRRAAVARSSALPRWAK